MSELHSPAPVRQVGALSLTAIAVNTMIGAGIFALPATMAGMLGPSSVAPYFVAGCSILLVALCFAEAGSQFESSGGPYLYAKASFGDFAGFQVSWLFIVARSTAVAAISNTFCDYLSLFIPVLSAGAGRISGITVLIAVLTIIHIRGIRLGTIVNNSLTVAKLLPLILFCIAGFFLLGFPASIFGIPDEVSKLQHASMLLIFALTGFENASVPGEEVINPRKTVPRAILGSVASVAILYVGIQIVAMAALPGLAKSSKPLAEAAQSMMGPIGALILTVGAVFSTAGSSHANILVGPRMLYALSRDGHLPPAIGWLHRSFKTPVVALLLFALLSWACAISSAFVYLAGVSAMARLTIFATTCLSVPVLRRRRPQSRESFRLPGGLLIPVAAFLACVWLLAGSTKAQLMGFAVALVIGFLSYWLFGKRRKL